MMNISNRDFEGEWWIPGKKQKLPGILSLHGNIELTLFGLFVDRDSNILQPDIILGVSGTGTKITIVNCLEIKRGSKSTFSGTFVFLNHHFDNKASIKIDKGRIEFSDLLQWLGTSPFNAENHKTKYGITIKKNRKPIILPKVGSFNRRIHIGYSHKADGDATINLRGFAFLELDGESGFAFNDFLNELNYFAQLLKVLYMFPAVPIEISLLKEDREIELYFNNSNYNLENKSRLGQYFIPYNDIRKEFKAVIKNYYKKLDKLDTVMDLLSDQIGRSRFDSDRFLNIVRAIEIYHRRFRKNEIKPQEDFEKEVDEILALAKNSKIKKRIRRFTKHANEPSLQERIKKILEELNIPFFETLIKDPILFSKCVADSRNFYTHLDKQSKKSGVKDGADLLHLTYKLRFVVVAVVLQELGIKNGKIDWLLKARKYQYFYSYLDTL